MSHRPGTINAAPSKSKQTEGVRAPFPVLGQCGVAHLAFLAQNLMLDCLLKEFDVPGMRGDAEETELLYWDAPFDPYASRKQKEDKEMVGDCLLFGDFRDVSEYGRQRDWTARVQNILKANDPRMETIRCPKPRRALPNLIHTMEEAARAQEEARRVRRKNTAATYIGNAIGADHTPVHNAAGHHKAPFFIPVQQLQTLVEEEEGRCAPFSINDNIANGENKTPRQKTSLAYQTLPTVYYHAVENGQDSASESSGAASSPYTDSWTDTYTILPAVTAKPTEWPTRRLTPGAGPLWRYH